MSKAPLLATIALGVCAGFAVQPQLEPRIYHSAPRPPLLDVKKLSRLFGTTAAPVQIAADPDNLLDAVEPHTPHEDALYGLHCVTENDCFVDLSAPGWTPDDSCYAFPAARFRPAIARGASAGLSIDRIRPESAYDRLGFHDGDTILTVNGMRLDRPEQALAASRALRGKTSIWVEVERDGKRIWKTWRVSALQT